MLLEDLKESVSKMDKEDLMELLRQLRTSRRTPVKRTGGSKKAPTRASVESLIDSLDEKALEKLIAEMEEKR